SANAGYTFDRFEGDCSGATCTLTNVTAAKSVTARFRANATPNPTPDPTPTPPAATVPAKPTDFKAVAGNKQVQLQWAAPSSDGGKPVSGYEVKVKNHASLGCTTKPGVTSCTIAGLTNGKTYTFQVMARNSVGQGPAASVEATPKADVSEPPKKPEGVTAQAGDGQVQVRWKAADAQAGVTGYAVRVKGQADLGCTATAQADHCIVKGLDNGQSYTLEIVALNAKGASAPASMMVRPVVTPLPEALGEVQKLYIAYYQRPADPAGLLFWEKKAREAGSMAKVVEAFADSREARRLYGKIDKGNIGKVIDKVYQALYNTKPDAKGKQHYEQGFAQGRYTAASIVLDILNGAKGEAHMAAVGNKMEAAAMFVRLLDPELDGSKVQATYDEKDEAAARHWLAGITSRATTTQSKTKAFIVQKLASPKDPIAQKSDK
ncbi:fibronectin type III domain-containing protein, partial [Comamonadaceae bacterium OH3737_COT-264]